MIDLKLYGQPTSSLEYIKMMMKRQAQRAGIQLQIEEINDVESFIKDGIESIPTIKINNHIHLTYDQKMDINRFITRVNETILKEENYGIMKKIIVPTDYSDVAQNALVFAQAIAQPLNGVIRLVHCYHPSNIDLGATGYYDSQQEEKDKKRLMDYAEQIRQTWVGGQSEKPMIDYEFRIGLASDEICEISKESGDSMVVIASTGSTDSIKKYLGSVSTEVVKACCRPVLVIPPDAEFAGFSKIVVAVDKNDYKQDLLERLIAFAKAFDSEIILLHVNKSDSTDLNLPVLDKLKEMAPMLKVSVELIEDGELLSSINNYIEEEKVDLLVMLRHQRNAFQEFFHKSQTTRMAVHTKIPLMVYHER
jgi:nucleotide-binding universal stress UspA family protein